MYLDNLAWKGKKIEDWAESSTSSSSAFVVSAPASNHLKCHEWNFLRRWRVVHRNSVTFRISSSTAIKQSHVKSHWSRQDFNVFGQVVGFVVWLHLLQQVAPRLEMHWHLYHPTWPKKNRKGMVQKRLVLIRKNSSYAKFTLTLGWNAVRCTSYIIHEKNLTLEGPQEFLSFVICFRWGAVAGSTGRPRSKANCAEVSSMKASSLTNPMTQLLKPWKTVLEPENQRPERWKLRIANYNYV